MSNLSLDKLKEIGAMKGKPVETVIKWKTDDEDVEFTVFVKRNTIATHKKFLFENSKEDVALVSIIYNSVCADENGTLLFENIEQVEDLDPSFFFALIGAVNEVNSKKK